MKKKFLRLCLTAIFLLAVSSAALSDIWIDDNVNYEGYVGRYYEADIHVLCNDIPSDYSYGLQGNLPPGLKWNDKGGGRMTIYGYPNKEGKYTFKATGSNWLGVGTEKKYTVEIKSSKSPEPNPEPDPAPIEQYEPTIEFSEGLYGMFTYSYNLLESANLLCKGIVGQDYHAAFVVKGASPITATVTGLSDGLSYYSYYDDVSKVHKISINGKPQKAGTYNLTLHASNEYGEATLDVVLIIEKEPAVTYVCLQDGLVGTKYMKTVNSVTGLRMYANAEGTMPITWMLLSGELPPGISTNIKPSDDGKSSLCYFEGTPTKEGTYEFTMRVSNSNGYNDEKFSITIKKDGIAINEENFPDAYLRLDVTLKFDKDLNGLLTTKEIAEAKVLSTSASSLAGIEYLTALEDLSCLGDPTRLDVSKNIALKKLYCSGNLTQLDVSKNTALTDLDCGYNRLTKLDVSKNTALTRLNCNNNQLTALDISKNTSLTLLNCDNNQLTALDVSKNTILTDLLCEHNQLTVLDVSKNTALKYLACSENRLAEIDLSKNTALETLYGHSQSRQTLRYARQDNVYSVNMNNYVSDISKLRSIRGWLANGYDTFGNYDSTTGIITFSSAPSCIIYEYYPGRSYKGTSCIEVKLTLAENPEIEPEPLSISGTLNDGIAGQAYSCKLTASGGTAPYTWSIVNELYLLLKKWGLSINSSTGEISGTPRNAGTYNFTVKVTDSSGASATGNFTITINEREPEPVSGIQINAANFPDSVFRSYVSGYFDKDGNGYLSDSEIASATSAYLDDREIKSLKGIEFFMCLKYLYCERNQMTELDVTKNTALKSLWCSNNQLTTLDVTKNTALESLACYNNQLTTLDITKNTALESLACYNNQLTVLDMSNSTALTSLNCRNNQLAALNVSKNTALTTLYCSDNRLTALDLSKNTALEYLNFNNNSNDNLVPEKQTDGTYKVDLMNYVPDFSRVSDIASDVTGGYYPNGVLICNSMPSFVAYNYDTKSPLSSKQKMYVVITVNASTIPAPEITTSELPQGKSGKQYDAELSVSGGRAPYTWIISGGTFPTGLTIDNTTGKISGTPAKAGSFTFKVKVTDANGKTNEASFTMNIENGAQVTTPKISGTLNNGIKKASYTGTLKVTGGTSPYKWSISSGALPTGLTLNESTGKISGIPTTAGTFKFTVKITDANKSTATKTYTVKITKPSISGTLSNGIKYASYTGTLKALNGTSPYTWSISEGALPTGLTIGESNGKISGTPTAAGTFKFTVKVADANNSAVTKAYTVKITKPSISGTLSNGIKYASYTGTLKASNGTAPYTWEIIDGTLPDGLTIGESTGKISGKPTKAGTFKFTVKVTDANSSAVTKAYSIKITKTTISGTLSNGIKYASYSNTLKASNGTAPYTWSISAGTLPDGLTIGESNGKISGTPTKAGTFKFTVKATDKNNSAVTKAYTVKITKPSISGSLSTGTVGKSYSKTLKATGGTASYTWTKSGGTLPSGLKLGKTTGKITGTPTKAGKFTFNVKVTDANNSTATKSFTVTIKSAETAAADITDEIYENIHFSETGDSPDSNNETLYGYEEPVMQNENIEVSDELHSYTAINLKIAGDDILNQGTDRDEDILEVRADMPVRFIAEAQLNSSEEMQVYVDDELIESIIVSDNGEFTVPAEMVHDDFKVQVKAGKLESHELYIIATEQ